MGSNRLKKSVMFFSSEPNTEHFQLELRLFFPWYYWACWRSYFCYEISRLIQPQSQLWGQLQALQGLLSLRALACSLLSASDSPWPSESPAKTVKIDTTSESHLTLVITCVTQSVVAPIEDPRSICLPFETELQPDCFFKR